MTYRVVPSERNLSRFENTRHSAFTRSPATVGLPATMSTTGAIICDSREVALIDEVCINATTADTAVNKTVTVQINGLTFPIHFPGSANLLRTERLVWRPRGNLVVHPGQFFAASGGGLFQEHMFVRFRKKELGQAIADGDIPGKGGLPNVASTNTVTAGGTAAGTAKAIVPAVSGKSVEILGMLFTGHNYNAAADNIRLGFWDGTTGNFGANGNTIIRAWRQNADIRYAKPLVIGNTDGCIQGPSGSGVYIQATANLAGATPTGDWVILYRYVDGNRLKVGSPTGAAGQTTFGEKFWVNTEAAAASTLGFQQLTRMFGVVTGTDLAVNIKGWVTSATVATTASTLVNEIGLGLGDGTLAAAATQTLGEMISMFASDDAAGAPAAVGHLFGQDDTLINTTLASIPAFALVEVAAADFANRSQLVWGKFSGDKLRAQDAVGRSQFSFILA